MTPRQQIHLNLLKMNKPQPEQYEEAAYLIDKKLLKGDYRRSNGKDDYGEILDILIDRLTPDGMDYLEKLEQIAAQAKSQEQAQQHRITAQNFSSMQMQQASKLWHERSGWCAFVFLVAVGLTVAAIAALFNFG